MGLVSTAFEVVDLAKELLGTTADSVAVFDAIHQALNRKGLTAVDLFESCVFTAIRRNTWKLRPGADPAEIAVNREGLRQALQRLETTVLTSSKSKGTTVRVIAESVANYVSAPHSDLASISADSLQPIVQDAFDDFFTKLPRFPAASAEVTNATLANQAQLLSEVLRRLPEIQSAVTQESPYLNASTMQQESSRVEYRNPFRIVKAEEFDHDYQRLAQLFRAPMEYDRIRGPGNVILQGGRGCGKSMILRSLSLPAAVRLIQLRNGDLSNTLTFEESGLEYVGVYFKLARGYFYNWTPDCKLTPDAAIHLSQHTLNIVLLSAVIETLLDARTKHILEISREVEIRATEGIGRILGLEMHGGGFPKLQNVLQEEQRFVANYIGNLRLGANSPEYKGSHTSIHDFLDRCCGVLKNSIPAIRNCRIYLLLDEYENLADFQQTIINTLAKLRPFSLSLKIATRPLGVKSLKDLQGEPIQQPRDYEIVDLDYKITDPSYRELLLDISEKRLVASGCLKTSLIEILEKPGRYAPHSETEVLDGIAKVLAQRGVQRSTVTDEKWNEYVHRLDEAVAYRIGLARHLRQPRAFAGFEDFMALSSGIVSNFLELCKLTFYLAETSGVNVRNGESISAEIQSNAVELTSNASLDWIANNIENTGPKLSRLVLDLADMIREKLIGSFSEPEAGRIVISDPQELDKAEYSELRDVIADGIRWSVFQTGRQSGAYFPRHRTEVRSLDFWLSRMLAPVLKISHRPRWRSELTVKELSDLLTDRKITRGKILRRARRDDDLPLLKDSLEPPTDN